MFPLRYLLVEKYLLLDNEASFLSRIARGICLLGGATGHIWVVVQIRGSFAFPNCRVSP